MIVNSVMDDMTYQDIRNKPVVPLLTWDKTQSQSPILSFSRSPKTYVIDGTPYVIISINYIPGVTDTAPTLNNINLEWNVAAGQQLSIPLTVFDQENDDVAINFAYQHVKPNFLPPPVTAQYLNKNELPTADFTWTPPPFEAFKTYTVNFDARELRSRGLASNTVTAKIHVWPPAWSVQDDTVKSFSLTAATWKNGILTLSGKLVLPDNLPKDLYANKLDLLSASTSAFITQGERGDGPMLAPPSQLKINRLNGDWSLTLNPVTQPSCHVTVQFIDNYAARAITGAPSGCAN